MASKNQKKALQIAFVFVAVVIAMVGISYGSGLAFFYLNKMPLDAVSPFTIFQYFTAYKSSPIKFVKFTVIACTIGPWVLLVVGAMFLLVNKKQRSLHGDARFATLSEVKAAGLIDPPKGLDKTILVGKFQGHYLTYAGFQFVMLAAPTRSGKGVGVVIPNCLNYSDSLVVLDIKLENFDITSGFRAAHGQEVYLFSPFDTNGRTHRYNPLSYISSDPAERIGDVDAIASALYAGDDKDKFWSENAKDLFRGLCLLVLETPDLPKTLGEILRQASGKGKPLPDHIEEMRTKAKKEGWSYTSACTDALDRILHNSENTLAGIVATFNTPLLIFQNPRVDLATSDNDFDLRDVRRKKMTIYLGVTPDKLSDAKVLINLFFDQLLNQNTRVLPQQDKSLKYQCLLILDEFTSIGRINMIQQAISYQAGYNMRVLTIIQNKSQLEDKYGKAGAITLMANHALMIMYAPSPVVQSDANEYSEMLGYETVKSKNKSRSTSAGAGSGSRSESESDQRRALMLPQEIKELGQWREIVSLENCKPILCDKIKYFEDPAFTQRTNWEVPSIPIQDVKAFMKKLGLGGLSEDTAQTASAVGNEAAAVNASAAIAIAAMPQNKADIDELSQYLDTGSYESNDQDCDAESNESELDPEIKAILQDALVQIECDGVGTDASTSDSSATADTAEPVEVDSADDADLSTVAQTERGDVGTDASTSDSSAATDTAEPVEVDSADDADLSTAAQTERGDVGTDASTSDSSAATDTAEPVEVDSADDADLSTAAQTEHVDVGTDASTSDSSAATDIAEPVEVDSADDADLSTAAQTERGDVGTDASTSASSAAADTTETVGVNSAADVAAAQAKLDGEAVDASTSDSGSSADAGEPMEVDVVANADESDPIVLSTASGKWCVCIEEDDIEDEEWRDNNSFSANVGSAKFCFAVSPYSADQESDQDNLAS